MNRRARGERRDRRGEEFWPRIEIRFAQMEDVGWAFIVSIPVRPSGCRGVRLLVGLWRVVRRLLSLLCGRRVLRGWLLVIEVWRIRLRLCGCFLLLIPVLFARSR
jgi:hypothetical protein